MNIKKYFQQKVVLKVIILLLFVVVGEIFFVHYTLNELDSEYGVLSDLKQIKLLDQKIEQLFNKKITYRSYDDMVADTDLMSQKISMMMSYQVFNEAGDELTIAYNRLAIKLKQFKENVEYYKSWNGITVNSIRYLFDLHSQIKDYVYKSDDLKSKDKISFYLDETVKSVAKINFDRTDNIQHLELNLKKLLSSTEHDKALHDDVKVMVLHSNMVIKGLNNLTDLENKNLKLSMGNDIDTIHALLLNRYKLNDAQYRNIVNGLQFIGLLLVVLLFIAQHKESISQSKISRLNEQLQNELSKIEIINEQMSTLLDQFDKNVIASKTDIKGNIVYASDSFVRISGYSKDELIGASHNIVRHPDMPKNIYKGLWETIKNGEVWRGEIKNRKKQGGYYWVSVTITPEIDESGNIISYSAIRHDITAQKNLEELSKTLEQKVEERTEELREMAQKNEQLSVTDELTGLFNRRQYALIIEREIKRARRNKEVFCYLSLDLDNFKLFNDTYGHYQGDELLKRVANELKLAIQRPGDYVFRMGGEEFTAIYAVSDYHDGIKLAENIIKGVERLQIEHLHNLPYKVVTFSAGLVLINTFDSDRTEGDIYKLADSLLYKSKELGRNRLQYKLF